MDLLKVLKEAFKGYLEMCELLEFIKEEINKFFKIMVDSEIMAAKQALESASASHHPDTEIRDAISHMRSAFNICLGDRDKTYTKRFLFFFSNEEDYHSQDNKSKISLYATQIATMIAFLYLRLGESRNASRWKNRAIECYKNYLIPSLLYELESINSRYVTEEILSVYADDFSDFVETETVISEEGKSYLKEWRPKEVEEFEKFFHQHQIQ